MTLTDDDPVEPCKRLQPVQVGLETLGHGGFRGGKYEGYLLGQVISCPACGRNLQIYTTVQEVPQQRYERDDDDGDT